MTFLSQSAHDFKELGKTECPICGHKDRCKSKPNREAVLCFRSTDQAVNGYHLYERNGECSTYLTDHPADTSGKHITFHATPKKSKAKPTTDFGDLMREYQDAMTHGLYCTDSRQLGVSVKSLKAFGAGCNKGALCFPERDATGKVIAVVTRWADEKKANPGSTRGLTYADSNDDRPGPTLCVEGASDCCTLWDMGIRGVGRFNNTGGAELLAEFYKEDSGLIIIGENDEKEDGRWPGRDGAEHVASELSAIWNRPVRWALPPADCKDARDFLIKRRAAGVSDTDAGKEFLAHVENTAVTVEPEPEQETGPIENDGPQWQPFPLDVFTPKIQRIIRNAAASIDVDTSMIALPLLALFASVIGNSRQLVIKTRHYAHAIFWGCIMGYSGDGKSPAIGVAIRQLQRLYRRGMAEYKKATEKYWAALAEWKDAPEEERGSKPPEPILARCYMDNTTVEALIPIHEENQRGLCIFSDELGGWIDGFNQYKKGGNDLSFWLSAFSGMPVSNDRKGSSGQPRQRYYIPRVAVSVCGGTQPATFTRIVKPEHLESGMIGRLLFAMPPDRLRQMSDAIITDEDERDLDSIVDLLYELQPDYGPTGELTPKFIGMSTTAKTIYENFSNRLYREIHTMHGDIRAAAVKKESYTTRMALVIQLSKWAAGEPGASADRVDEGSMEQAIRLVQWFTNEDRRVYAMLNEGFVEQADRELIETIGGLGGRSSVRNIMHHCRKYRGDADNLRFALDRLVKAGRGRWEYEKTGGKDKETFVLNTKGDHA